MQISVIVSVIGPDRPGLIDRLSSVIVSAGGNWEDSRMLRLAGQFAGMVQVVVAEEALPSLESGLSQLEGEGLQAGSTAPLCPPTNPDRGAPSISRWWDRTARASSAPSRAPSPGSG